MKKWLILLAVVMFSSQINARDVSMESIAENLSSDMTTSRFIQQFKGTSGHKYFQLKSYNIDVWKDLAQKDDALAAYMLLQYHHVNGESEKALKYAAIAYSQTHQKQYLLAMFQSIYQDLYGNSDRFEAVKSEIRQLRDESLGASFADEGSANNVVSDNSSALINDRKGELAELIERVSLEHRNFYVQYEFDVSDEGE
ncbi:hypothetical protein PN836_014790 [Ningiella sp. W23]|uniref:hypothetical protein n=1 Tax=Ningiella sp. W23 TaxID=3023715 RepID=UPI00375825B2